MTNKIEEKALNFLGKVYKHIANPEATVSDDLAIRKCLGYDFEKTVIDPARPWGRPGIEVVQDPSYTEEKESFCKWFESLNIQRPKEAEILA